MTSVGVLGTSVFIAQESGRRLDASGVPDEVATTVVTVAELNLGVLAAASADVRAQRLATLDAIADILAFPVDNDAAHMWARLRMHLVEKGQRVRINDLWIAAIAASRGLPVVTQDEDFDPPQWSRRLDCSPGLAYRAGWRLSRRGPGEIRWHTIKYVGPLGVSMKNTSYSGNCTGASSNSRRRDRQS